MSKNCCIGYIKLDEKSAFQRSPQVEHERKVAIYDLLEENYFRPRESNSGPFNLYLSVTDNRIVFEVRCEQDIPVTTFTLSASTFRKIVKDYFLVCESYFEAIKSAPPSQIEAIDMGRRGLHNDGALLLQEQLKKSVEIDIPTARRLFTLICVLHMKGDYKGV
ncbi:MAG: hypothetical protein CFH06_01883 [Alphaproteobacteria bacterium MarineAlpha3_Bin5]|nr:hypothetical protein [Magnetovibrio sp.]PPR75818.1 MAG: hypothetical protein CFH06_01883 [Alphaproteobacteria bacterium MarineAlpha3_Bin5]